MKDKATKSVASVKLKHLLYAGIMLSVTYLSSFLGSISTLFDISASTTAIVSFCVLFIFAALVLYTFLGVFDSQSAKSSNNKCIKYLLEFHVPVALGFNICFNIIFWCMLLLAYGETNKPLEKLNGIALGQHYTKADLVAEGVNVKEGGEGDVFTYQIKDNQQPQLTTEVFQDPNYGVTKVTMTFSDFKDASSILTAKRIRNELAGFYGGKKSYTDAFLKHGDNQLYVEANHSTVIISLASAHHHYGELTASEAEFQSIQSRVFGKL